MVTTGDRPDCKVGVLALSAGDWYFTSPYRAISRRQSRNLHLLVLQIISVLLLLSGGLDYPGINQTIMLSQYYTSPGVLDGAVH